MSTDYRVWAASNSAMAQGLVSTGTAGDHAERNFAWGVDLEATSLREIDHILITDDVYELSTAEIVVRR